MSEPDLKDDCMFTDFLNFIPNQFCFKPEPHELVCKSATAILHRIVWACLWYFCKHFRSWSLVVRFFIFQTQKCVFGPGDVLACPIIYRFVYPQTLSDPPQKLIVHTFPSIWQSPFFINIFKQIKISSKGGLGKLHFVLNCIAYCIAYWTV